MQGVAGREAFVKRAVLADTTPNARLLRDWAELFEAYHSEVGPVDAIVIKQSAPVLVVDGTTAFGLFPADYVTPAPGFVDRLRSLSADLQAAGFTLGNLWTTGVEDPAMEAPPHELGWNEIHAGVEAQLFENTQSD